LHSLHVPFILELPLPLQRTPEDPMKRRNRDRRFTLAKRASEELLPLMVGSIAHRGTFSETPSFP
jgi:hypothetical protein